MTYIFRTLARWRSLNPWRIWCVICHATILNSVHLQRSRKLFDKMLGICMSVCAARTLCTIHLLLLDRDYGVECICQQWATNIYLLATINSSKKEVHNGYLHLFSSQCGQIVIALYSVWWVHLHHLKAIEICYIIKIQRSWDLFVQTNPCFYSILAKQIVLELASQQHHFTATLLKAFVSRGS
jgi:hypothetical protein